MGTMRWQDWAYLVATIIIAGSGILVVAGGWAELTTPAAVGGFLVAIGTVVANYFKPSPKQD